MALSSKVERQNDSQAEDGGKERNSQAESWPWMARHRENGSEAWRKVSMAKFVFRKAKASGLFIKKRAAISN